MCQRIEGTMILDKELLRGFTGVLHLGANIGEEYQMYKDLGINKRIWVEANPELLDKLHQNVGKDRVINALVGQTPGTSILHIASNYGQSSSILEFGTHLTQHPDVRFVKDIVLRVQRLDNILTPRELSDVNLLVVDLQGYDLMAMRGMGLLLHLFEGVVTEVNKAEVYKNCNLKDEVDLFLGQRGFQEKTVRWIGDWGDAFYEKVT
jgi:FkbM family methyltransferase